MSDLISKRSATERLIIAKTLLETVLQGMSTAEPRKGKWIPVTNGRGGFECSLCHSYSPAYQNGDDYLSRFCPDCGADMRGEQNE